jgi:tRNA U34 2-thiouridine synthase MnmA/TrmU
MADGQPWFVAEKDLENNILYAVQGEENPALYSKGLTAENVIGLPAGLRQMSLPVRPSSVIASRIRA